ncbi:FecR family protein [Mucilaginibacter sp. HC2]|uniref:FecR family protein n=1 Tax=Mucilaginibacter inviolabilis TaxID=2714892 RepID=UPI00140CB67C|nr:FecR family protein [Mucilaginibacter inviolabilis]NHA03399.1 FecR family protein [Mucilaginibacter inviolabilis]
MSEKLFFQLLSRQLAGEATSDELKKLKLLTEENPEWNKLYHDLNYNKANQTEGEQVKAEQAYMLHMLKMQLAVPKKEVEAENNVIRLPFYIKYMRPLIGAAASLLIIGSIVAYTFSGNNPEKKLSNLIQTKKGSKTNIKLPDGTTVWVNSDSKIWYADNFNSKTREVWLSGEAFFDVKHDSQHPFIIHTDKVNITDLGTAFNVKSYPNDPDIETSLIRGKVDITFNDRPNEHFTLHPNEKLTVSRNQTSNGQISKINEGEPKIKLDNLKSLNADHVISETAWVYNKIGLNNITFEDIAVQLERRFDVEITFKDNVVRHYHYTGVFEDENLEEILNILQISKPFNYKMNGRKITISQ